MGMLLSLFHSYAYGFKHGEKSNSKTYNPINFKANQRNHNTPRHEQGQYHKNFLPHIQSDR